MLVGGAPAEGRDFLTRATRSSRGSSPLRSLLTYLVLAARFRSVLLPLKAVLLNLLSVAAVYGLLVTSSATASAPTCSGVQRSAQIEGWIPIFLFAALFGLSMDYEVFLVSRMREAWDATPRQRRAPSRSGSSAPAALITAAALVMARVVRRLRRRQRARACSSSGSASRSQS